MKPMMISSQLKRLASILCDNHYHSGTEIGNELGLTRSGIWKLIKQLELLGLEIESVTNKGYKLTQPLELLDKNKIKKSLNTNNRRLLDKLFIFDDLESTNDYLTAYSRQSKGETVACLAERQTAGRGRLGREWISPFAANLYLSLLWPFTRDISELAGLNIVVGISTMQAIQEVSNRDDIKLKWPNDIFWKNNKLGGILIDIHGEHNGGCTAVIGIGVNVHMPRAHASMIHKPWTDLQQMTNHPVSRNQLASCLLNRLIENLTLFQEKGTASFIKQWAQFDYLQGKKTIIKSGTASLKGIAKGINEQGYLVLKLENGSLRLIASGDASILLTQ